MNYPLYIGCTAVRHKQLGVDAVVNARGCRQDLNDRTLEDIELMRDAQAIHRKLADRVRWYGPSSKFFRRNIRRIEHLIDDRNE